MKNPILIALGAGAAVLLVALLLPLLNMFAGRPPPSPEGQPWQVQRHGGGTRVFGLDLPGSVLADAKARWGDGLQVAVIARRGDEGALEGYVETVDAGGIAGRLVLATGLAPAAVATLRADAARQEPIDGESARFGLRADGRAAALRAALVGITFIPAAKLDAAVVRQRFGEPAERLATPPRLEHWLYPALGLDIALDSEGKDVLQYVAPADFEVRLRQPLVRAGATPVPDRR
jgi:hypothetical protein